MHSLASTNTNIYIKFDYKELKFDRTQLNPLLVKNSYNEINSMLTELEAIEEAEEIKKIFLTIQK